MNELILGSRKINLERKFPQNKFGTKIANKQNKFLNENRIDAILEMIGAKAVITYKRLRTSRNATDNIDKSGFSTCEMSDKTC